MERLDHPNVIRLFEVNETFTHMNIAMECASEGDLQDRVVKDGPMSESNARPVFSQVVAAMRHMVSMTSMHAALSISLALSPHLSSSQYCSVLVFML